MYICSFDETNNGCINYTKGYVIESWTIISYSCVTRHMYFVLFNFTVVPFILLEIYILIDFVFFFFSFISFWRHKYFIFISDESFIFLFHLVSIEFYIFLYKFLSQRARDNFLSMLLLWSLNLFIFFFFLYYDVRITLHHFKIIIIYNYIWKFCIYHQEFYFFQKIY